MIRRLKRSAIVLFLLLTIQLPLSVSAFATVSDDTLSATVSDTAQYLCHTVKTPQVGSIGGEWAVIGLARSGYVLPQEYYQAYYDTVVSYVKACKGILHEKKYTEYSRLILAMSAMGIDARDVAGYDLTYALADYDKTIWQGVNGPIWALLALDSRHYPMPQNREAKTQATRQMYVDAILKAQQPDGGWSLFDATSTTVDSVSDPDMTGMALQALAKYLQQEKVKTATDKALAYLSKVQNADGGFGSWGTDNAESCVQLIVALCELGISLEDSRFVKNGQTVLDALMDYYLPSNGFLHTTHGGGSNQMATEQAFYALVAVQRAREGRESLYRMEDTKALVQTQTEKREIGLTDRHIGVQPQPIRTSIMTFKDVIDHQNQTAIEALAVRGIVCGKGDGCFAPDASMTRAEFATMVVRALGLTPQSNNAFADIRSTDWFAPYVDTAYHYGIVYGVGEGKFYPNGTISRQEAAVMVARAARLCGMNPVLQNSEIRDILAQFSDYVTTANWARESLAFCFKEHLLDENMLAIQPLAEIKRCEMAQMLFSLLVSAELL